MPPRAGQGCVLYLVEIFGDFSNKIYPRAVVVYIKSKVKNMQQTMLLHMCVQGIPTCIHI